MNAKLNNHRLNNLLRGIQTSIGLFESQGYPHVYFTAQFLRGGRKQNCIDKGDIHSFNKQVRTYIASEEADTVRVEFFCEDSGKSIYSKALNDLRIVIPASAEQAVAIAAPTGLGGYVGLGEAQVNEMITKKVAEERRNDEFQRLTTEVAELRSKNEELATKNEDLEESVKAKSDIEFYSGVIGTAFPGLAQLFTGTPLAQAAGFLAGTNGLNGTASSANEAAKDDSQSIATMVGEFCSTLNKQEAGAIHLLFIAFEADRSKIQSALHHVTTTAKANPTAN